MSAPALDRAVAPREMVPPPDLTIAANQGTVGGGEVMLLALAEAARELGLDVRVVGPADPGELVGLARAAGFDTVGLPGQTRADYLRALRRWDRSRRGLLWCNGLLPATATAGHADRVVHLHQDPRSALQRLARVVAVRRTRAVVVPSAWMGATVPHTVVLANWTADLVPRAPRRTAGATSGPRVVGYLGRVTEQKGVDVLARAVAALRADGEDVALLLAGDDRFADPAARARVEDALAPLGEHVRRLGWVSRTAFFSSVDLAVFPSVADEPFGLVAAEAMATGVPFVVSDAGALPEVCGPTHPWIARRGDALDLAEQIRQALATDAGRRGTVARAQRARWRREYSPAAGRERLRVLLDDLGLPVGTARARSGARTR